VKTFRITLWFLSLLAVPSPARAIVTTYFNEGFDGYADGSSILASSSNWTLTGDPIPAGSSATATISTNAFVSSDRSLKLNTASGETLLRPQWNRTLAVTSASAATPMTLAAVSFDFNYNYNNSLSDPQGTANKGFVQDEWIYVRNHANQVVGQIRLNAGYSDWRFGNNYQVGASGANVRTSNWHNVDMVFNFTNQTATYYLDNVQQYVENLGGLLNSSIGLSALTFENGINGPNGVQNNTNFVDNVVYWADLAQPAGAPATFNVAAFNAGDQSINNGNGWKNYSNNGNYLSDSESYVMRSYNQMYRATGNTSYLDKMIDHADAVLASRDDFANLPHEEPGNNPVWSTSQYGLVSAPLTNGMIMQAMAQFARIVKEDPALSSNPTYAAKAATYIQRVQETVNWLNTNYLRTTGTGRSSYSAYPNHADQDAPHVDATLGSILLDMYHATDDVSFRNLADRLARNIQVSAFFTTDEGNLAWKYDYGGSDAEDISHGAHAAPFLSRMAAEGRIITNAQAKALAASIVEEAYLGSGNVTSGMEGSAPIEGRFGPLPPSYWSWGMAGGMIELAQFDLRLLPLAREVQLHHFGATPNGSGSALLGMAELVRYNEVPQEFELSLKVEGGGATYRTTVPATATLSGELELQLVNQSNLNDVQHVRVKLGGDGDEWEKLWQLDLSLDASGSPLLLNRQATLTLSLLDGLETLKQMLGSSLPLGYAATLSQLGDRLTLTGTLTASQLFEIDANEKSFDLPGDADWDGDVDLSDLSLLAGHYGNSTSMTWINGDFDRDGDVDLSDLSSLASHYGTGQAQAFADFQSLAGINVPEPAAATVSVAVGSLALIRGVRCTERKTKRGI